MVFNVEWGDGEEYETFNPDKAKQKAKDKGGKVFLSDDMKGRLKNDEQVYPDPNEFELPGIRKKKTKQGKITSLKARLARLRLGSEEPYNEYTKNTGDKRKKKNKLTRSDQKRGKKDKDKVKGSHSGRNKRQEGSTQEYSGFGEYIKNTGDKRKKKNKLTRSDQKRGKKELRKKLDKVSEQSAIEEFEVGMDANKEVGCGINGCKYKITADQAKKQGLDSNNLWEHRYSHTD